MAQQETELPLGNEEDNDDTADPIAAGDPEKSPRTLSFINNVQSAVAQIEDRLASSPSAHPPPPNRLELSETPPGPKDPLITRVEFLESSLSLSPPAGSEPSSPADSLLERTCSRESATASSGAVEFTTIPNDTNTSEFTVVAATRLSVSEEMVHDGSVLNIATDGGRGSVASIAPIVEQFETPATPEFTKEQEADIIGAPIAPIVEQFEGPALHSSQTELEATTEVVSRPIAPIVEHFETSTQSLQSASSEGHPADMQMALTSSDALLKSEAAPAVISTINKSGPADIDQSEKAHTDNIVASALSSEPAVRLASSNPVEEEQCSASDMIEPQEERNDAHGVSQTTWYPNVSEHSLSSTPPSGPKCEDDSLVGNTKPQSARNATASLGPHQGPEPHTSSSHKAPDLHASVTTKTTTTEVVDAAILQTGANDAKCMMSVATSDHAELDNKMQSNQSTPAHANSEVGPDTILLCETKANTNYPYLKDVVGDTSTEESRYQEQSGNREGELVLTGEGCNTTAENLSSGRKDHEGKVQTSIDLITSRSDSDPNVETCKLEANSEASTAWNVGSHEAFGFSPQGTLVVNGSCERHQSDMVHLAPCASQDIHDLEKLDSKKFEVGQHDEDVTPSKDVPQRANRDEVSAEAEIEAVISAKAATKAVIAEESSEETSTADPREDTEGESGEANAAKVRLARDQLSKMSLDSSVKKSHRSPSIRRTGDPNASPLRAIERLPASGQTHRPPTTSYTGKCYSNETKRNPQQATSLTSSLLDKPPASPRHRFVKSLSASSRGADRTLPGLHSRLEVTRAAKTPPTRARTTVGLTSMESEQERIIQKDQESPRQITQASPDRTPHLPRVAGLAFTRRKPSTPQSMPSFRTRTKVPRGATLSTIAPRSKSTLSSLSSARKVGMGSSPVTPNIADKSGNKPRPVVRRALSFNYPKHSEVALSQRSRAVSSQSHGVNDTKAMSSFQRSDSRSPASSPGSGSKPFHDGRFKLTVPEPFALAGPELQERSQRQMEETRRKVAAAEARPRVFKPRPMPDFSKPYPKPHT